MSTTLASPRIQLVVPTSTLNAFWRMGRAIDRVGRQMRATLNRVGMKPLSDDERYVLRLAREHVAEGRTDLAAEDFAWLGSRLGGDAS